MNESICFVNFRCLPPVTENIQTLFAATEKYAFKKFFSSFRNEREELAETSVSESEEKVSLKIPFTSKYRFH